MEKKRDFTMQRSGTIPPLNLTHLDSESSRKTTISKTPDADSLNPRETSGPPTPHSDPNKILLSLIEAAQTISFTSTCLHRTVSRCLGYIGNDNLHAIFSTLLYKLRASTEKLTTLLELIEKRPLPDAKPELLQATLHSIGLLKELCGSLKTRLSTIAQGLDPKYSRQLILAVYGATVDIKEVWESLKPHRCVRGDNSQLYVHLRNAVANSLQVLSSLKQFVEDTLVNQQIPASLDKKLHELLRQTQCATDLSLRLDKVVEANMGSHKEDLLSLPTRTESSRRIWEDTSVYLKAIVGVMTFIRLIQTEENFSWSKQIKQSCLYVTRMTAEVAKIWNNYSTFAEDGFFLGRQERSLSVSEQSISYSSPTSDIPRHPDQ